MPALPTAVVHVLEEDRALARTLAPADRAAATQHLVAAEHNVPEGPWPALHALGSTPGDLGFLVVDGLLVRDVHVGRHVCGELLGPGDVLRPWDVDDADDAPIKSTSDWRALEPVRLAVLDSRFARLAGRFPALTAELLSRALKRSRRLAILLAVSGMPRLDARLLAVLWHLADRFGHVTAEGTHVPIRLTHETLANLVSAQRPSVTTALRGLERADLVRRDDQGGWLLLGDPPGDPEHALDNAPAPAS